MCEVTGGRSYLISSQRMLFQCLESLVAKIQPGVVVNFEKFGPDPPALKASKKTQKKRCYFILFYNFCVSNRRRCDDDGSSMGKV